MSQARPLESYYEPEPNSGCWLWLGARDGRGYGRTDRKRGSNFAHRVVYGVARIPSGLQIDHRCFNKSCVNPSHLRVVTHQENMWRTPRAMQTVCKRGHAFTTENTYTWRSPRGSMRACRTCRKQDQQKLRDRRKA